MTAACAPQGPRTSTVVARPSDAHLAEAYGRLPLHFEENRGQADPSTRFIARAGGDRVLLGTTGLQLTVDGHPVRLSFAGRTAEPKLHTLDPLPGRVNYYVGTDAAHWRTDIPTQVRYSTRCHAGGSGRCIHAIACSSTASPLMLATDAAAVWM